jgi:hypothetical protein
VEREEGSRARSDEARGRREREGRGGESIIHFLILVPWRRLQFAVVILSSQVITRLMRTKVQQLLQLEEDVTMSIQFLSLEIPLLCSIGTHLFAILKEILPH